MSSCFNDDDGPDIVTLECDGFDFEIAESEWIIFPEGPEYSFQAQGNTFELISEYEISEPFTLEFERPGFSFFPIGGNRECFSSFLSFHESNDGNIRFFNEIRNFNNGESVFSSFAVDDLSFFLEITDDSISVSRIGEMNDGFDPTIFATFDSLSLEDRNFENVLRITNPSPELQPEDIFIARNLGLIAFNRNDTLWLRN